MSREEINSDGGGLHLSDQDLITRLRNPEDNFVERKSANDYKDCLDTAVAFANTLPPDAPGIIFLPVLNDGRVQSDQNLDALQKKVTGRINRAYPPIVFIQKILWTEHGEPLIAVLVWGSSGRPHFAGQAFVRVGSETKSASEKQFEELVASRNSKTREILKWKNKTITWATMAPDGRAVAISGPIKGIQPVVVTDCNQFFLTVRTSPGAVWSFPLGRVEISFDNPNNRLQLETRPI